MGWRPLPPPPLHAGTAGRNPLNEEITPLLPTGIGERYCQTISNFRTCSANVNSPYKWKCWTNSGGPLVNYCSVLSPQFQFSLSAVTLGIYLALQMKGRWESNINGWIPFIYSQKWNCAASLFTKQKYNVCLPIPTLIYLLEIYVYISRIGLSIWCSQICGSILGIYKQLTDTWMWKLGLRPRNF
jgi:hypothetical protein